LDYRSEGGESPRELQARLLPWLRAAAEAGEPLLAIAHKGVLRALYALATGWDMVMEPQEKLANDAVHLFRLEPGGRLAVDRLNLPLLEPSSAR
ncbi:MAG: histidine phosphatase family protein, partial [Dongiaceae bacterium]